MKQASNALPLVALLLSACASPEVVDEIDPMDHRLSCSQIEQEIEAVQATFEDAEDRKGLTFRNIVTTTVFFPITMATYGNANEAMEASRARQKHLMQLYASRGCGHEGQKQQVQYQLVPVMQPATTNQSAPVSYSVQQQPLSYSYSEHVSNNESLPNSQYSPSHVHWARHLFE